jgi:metal-sulfur cluster biosynthetic enzyme
MIRKEKIWQKLKSVLDPELGINVVDLGLIYDIKVENGRIEILMTLTTPSCPLSSFLQKSMEDKVKEVSGVKEVKIDVTFDPPWNPSKMSKVARAQLGL